MSRFTSDQLAFATTKQRYLARDEAIEFLKTMDIKYSVGHWSAGDFCDRFAPPGYNSDNPSFKNDFEGQCRRTKAAGVDAIEIHQSVFEKGGAARNGDIDWKALESARDGYLAELGMTVTACNFNTWSNPKFKLGGPCNPDPEIRSAALEELRKGLEISKALKIPVMSVWPGSDGADYHFQIDYKQSLEWFTEALVTLNKEAMAAGIRLAMEPKPYEPHRELYMIIPTAASAVLVASRVNQICGGTNCGLTIDYGHQEDGGHHGIDVRAISPRVRRRARAQVRHQRRAPGTQRPGLDVFGTVSIPESVEYLFTTFVRDYRGYDSQDQLTYRDDPTRAMERSMINLANLSLKAIRIYARAGTSSTPRAPREPVQTFWIW